MSWIDLIVVAIVIIAMIIGFWRGFLKTLVGLVSIVVAFSLSAACAQPVAEKLYDNYLETTVTEALGGLTGKITPVAAVGRTYAAVSQSTSSASADLSVLKDIAGILRRVDPAVLADLDPDQMQSLVNFLCSSACKNRTISACVSAYNKKYGTNLNINPILSALGVSGSFKIPAAISLTGMKINVKTPLKTVQAENIKKASDAAVAAAAASKAAASKSTSSKSTSSKSTSSKSTSSKSTSSKSTTSGSATSKSTASRSTTSNATVSKAVSSTASVYAAASIPDAAAVASARGLLDQLLEKIKIYEQTPTRAEILRTLAVKLIAGLVFLVLFLIIRLILLAFARLLSRIVDKIPILGGLNKFLGGLAGIVSGVLVSIVLLVAFVSVSPVITDDRYVALCENSLCCRTVSSVVFGDTAATAGTDVTSGDDSQYFDDDEQYFDDEEVFDDGE